MTLHFFAIPALSSQPAQDEFNRFCLTHRVVSIERQFVGDGANAYLDSADRFLLNHSAVCAHVRYMDDIVWWCRSRQEATETLQLLRDFLWQSRKLTVKSTVQIRQSRQGLCFCGFRVRQGIVLPSSRKLSRYRAGLRRINTARANAAVSEQQMQRAYDNLLATLKGTQSLTFRQRLLGNDETEMDLYTIGSGCRS